MGLDAFVASGATALGLALVFLWLLIVERIVPFGRLWESQKERDEFRNTAQQAMDMLMKQIAANHEASTAVRQLAAEIRAMVERNHR